MDYLERLEKALDSLEREAEKVSEISTLIKTLGSVADEVSGEKKEIVDAIEALNLWSAEVANDIRKIDSDVIAIKEDSDKRSSDLNQSLGASFRNVDLKIEALQSQIRTYINDLDKQLERVRQEGNIIYERLSEKIGAESKTLNNNISEKHVQVKETIENAEINLYEKLKVQETKLGNAEEHIADDISQLRKQLGDTEEHIADDISQLKKQLEANNEALSGELDKVRKIEIATLVCSIATAILVIVMHYM